MSDWRGLALEMERLTRLRTFPVAYKRLEKAEELEGIPRLRRLEHYFSFCQLPSLVRTHGWTMGATAQDDIDDRCARIHGLAAATAESMDEEAANMGTVWFASVEEALKQQADYPRVPPGGAIALAPLASAKFDPDVVLVYGLPVQLMLILNGLQRVKYERFQFHFIGEGACADSLAQCYVSGKPSLAIPCFGERRWGTVTDEELVLALPSPSVERAVEGMQKLAAAGIRYPIPFYGAECDHWPAMAKTYPDLAKRRQRQKGG